MALACPECGAVSKVLDGRNRQDGSYKRYRKCKVCGHKFLSYEITDALLNNMITQLIIFEQIKMLVEKSLKDKGREGY